MKDNFRKATDLGAKLTELGFDEAETQALLDIAAPAAAFTTNPTVDDVPVGGSKLAGLPDLPAGTQWPFRPAYGDLDKQIPELEANMDRYQSGKSKIVKRHMVPCEVAGLERHIGLISNPSPLPFFGQINLAEAWAAQPDLPEEFPREGLVSLFYDIEVQPWGVEPGHKVGFQLLYSEETELERQPFPDALEAVIASDREIKKMTRHARYMGYARDKQSALDRLLRKTPELEESTLPALEPLLPAEHSISLEQAVTLPEFDAIYDALCKVTPGYDRDDDKTPLAKLWDHLFEVTSYSQVGGHAFSVQDPDMPREAQFASGGARWGSPEDKALREKLAPGAVDWVLLAQFTAFDRVWRLGDAGTLYVWMRKQDIAARAFHKAWIIVQSH